MRSAGWHVGAAHVADGTLEEERRHWLSLGGRRSLFSTHVRCRPFTQPSYHPASTRIILFDACSGVAVSMPWKRLLSVPQQGTNGLGIDVSGPASSGWVNESHARSAALTLSSRVGMKQTFRRGVRSGGSLTYISLWRYPGRKINRGEPGISRF